MSVIFVLAMVGCSGRGEREWPPLVEGRDWFLPAATVVEDVPGGDNEDDHAFVVAEVVTELVTAPTVAPTVVRTDPVRRVAVAGALSESEMVEVLNASGWPLELHTQALAVAFCESTWRPGAVNLSSGVTGLFQLWDGWYRYSGVNSADWADPVVNARAAYGAYRYSGGWRQWQCQPS